MDLKQLFEEILEESLREMELNKIGDMWSIIFPNGQQYQYSDENEAFEKARKALDSKKYEYITIKRSLQDGSFDPDATKILRNQPNN
jgi:hypothetical protein